MTEEESMDATEGLTTWKELFRDKIIPEWTRLLEEQRIKEKEENKHADNRTDTVGKKVMRDCRKFYRVLWKHRFGHVANMDDRVKQQCVKTLLIEIGINPKYVDLDPKRYILFFDRQSMPTRGRVARNEACLKDFPPLAVLQGYSVTKRDNFLTHPVFGTLYILLYYTFFSHYINETKEEFKEVVSIELLNVMSKVLNECMRAVGPYGAEISKKD